MVSELSALTSLLGNEIHGAETVNSNNPLTPKPTHFKPTAKRIIYLYMDGGPSQVDTFDYKPMLEKMNGKDPRQAMGKLEPTQF